MYQQTFSHNWEHIFIDANLEKLLVEKGSVHTWVQNIMPCDLNQKKPKSQHFKFECFIPSKNLKATCTLYCTPCGHDIEILQVPIPESRRTVPVIKLDEFLLTETCSQWRVGISNCFISFIIMCIFYDDPIIIWFRSLAVVFGAADVMWWSIYGAGWALLCVPLQSTLWSEVM